MLLPGFVITVQNIGFVYLGGVSHIGFLTFMDLC